jgi:hypothetical protein
MSKQPKSNLPPDLELVHEGVRVVSVTFGLNLFTAEPFAALGDKLLACQERFLQLCPPDEVKFYRTETMGEHKPVTKRVLGMLAAWFKPGLPLRRLIGLELKNGDDDRAAPTFRFQVLGEAKGPAAPDGWSNLISLAFPAEWGTGRTEEMLALAQELCGLVPVRSGYAGYVFECSPYAVKVSQPHAWQKSMRHRGIDIYLGEREETVAARCNAVKSVNWLTILCNDFVAGLGGAAGLKKAAPGCDTLPVPGGLIVRAGDAPAAGDTNRKDYLPVYREAYRFVRPLVELAAEQSPWLSLGADEEEKMKRWYRRFEHGSR